MNFDEVLDKMDNVKYNNDRVRIKIDNVIEEMTLLELLPSELHQLDEQEIHGDDDYPVEQRLDKARQQKRTGKANQGDLPINEQAGDEGSVDTKAGDEQTAFEGLGIVHHGAFIG